MNPKVAPMHSGSLEALAALLRVPAVRVVYGRDASLAFGGAVRETLFPIRAADAVGVGGSRELLGRGDDETWARSWTRLCAGSVAPNVVEAACGAPPLDSVCVVADYAAAVDDLLGGRRRFVAVHADGTLLSALPAGTLLLSGSFNPLHQGHRELLDRTGAWAELSLFNVDKPPLSRDEALTRLSQFAGAHSVVLTLASTFVQKVTTLDGLAGFVVGHDTAERLPMAKYYGGPEGAEAARRVFAERSIRFWTAGRVRADGSFAAELPSGAWAPLFEAIPDFRSDLSSTSIRQQQQQEQQQGHQ